MDCRRSINLLQSKTMLRALNATRKTMLAEKVMDCGGFLRRLVGGLLKATLQPDEGFYLHPCRGIHTLGMRMAIDAIYINQAGKIVQIATLPPGRIGPWLRQAGSILEVVAGKAKSSGCQIGDEILFQ